MDAVSVRNDDVSKAVEVLRDNGIEAEGPTYCFKCSKWSLAGLLEDGRAFGICDEFSAGKERHATNEDGWCAWSDESDE